MHLLEVERKFAFKRSLLDKFRFNKRTPLFSRVQPQGRQTIHDRYYDYCVVQKGKRKDTLMSHGVWLRQRNNIWEAKHRIPSLTNHQHDPYLRTVLKELTCPRKIHQLPASYVPNPPLKEDSAVCFGLQRIVDFTTFREKYLIDDRFKVVLDETCFGHSVGEVEVLVSPGKEKQAHANMDEFMEGYGWFFQSEGEVKGKLTAYFDKFPMDST